MLSPHSHGDKFVCTRRRVYLLPVCLCAILAVAFLLTGNFPSGTAEFVPALIPSDEGKTCPWQLANFSFTLTERLINEVLSATTPQVQSAIRNVTIPPQKVEHADVDAMDLVNFTLRNLTLHLAVPSTPYMTAEAHGMGVQIGETNFTAHVLLSRCKGVFWSNMTNMTLQLPLRLRHHDNGTLYTEVGKATFVDGNFTFDHRLDSAFCRVAQSVVELFMGEINAMVERKTIEALQDQLPESIQAQLNEQLLASPLFFYVDPLIEHDKIMATADLIRGRTTVPVASTAALLPHRDIAFDVPAYTINHVLDDLRCHEALATRIETGWTTDQIKDIFPIVTSLCPNCTLDVVVSGNTGPTELHVESLAVNGTENGGRLELSSDQLRFGVVMHAASPMDGLRIRTVLTQNTTKSGEEEALLTHFFHRFVDTNGTDVPLILIEANMTASARDVRIVGAQRDHIAVHVEPMQRLHFAVVASNIGPIPDQTLADLTDLVNRYLIPLLNAASPYNLGPLLQRVVLEFAGRTVLAASDVVYSLE